MTVIVAWAIATILAGCLICRPFAYNWDKTIPGGYCGDQVTSFTITGIINLVTDVIVLVLPMRNLSKLQMATYKKVTLIAVFGLGAVYVHSPPFILGIAGSRLLTGDKQNMRDLRPPHLRPLHNELHRYHLHYTKSQYLQRDRAVSGRDPRLRAHDAAAAWSKGREHQCNGPNARLLGFQLAPARAFKVPFQAEGEQELQDW